MGLFEQIERIGASADIVTTILDLVQWLRKGQVTDITLPYDCGYAASSLQHLLEEKGVQVLNISVIGDDIILRVNTNQSKYAVYWLQKWIS